MSLIPQHFVTFSFCDRTLVWVFVCIRQVRVEFVIQSAFYKDHNLVHGLIEQKNTFMPHSLLHLVH